MDYERSLVAQITDADACSVYLRAGLLKKHIQDKRYAEVFDYGMAYFREYGEMKTAIPVELLRDQFDGWDELVEGAVAAEPGFLTEKVFENFIRVNVEAALNNAMPQMATYPRVASAYLYNTLSFINRDLTRADTTIEYGKDMELYRKMVDERALMQGAPYPLEMMQNHTGGIKPGEMVVLVAPSGMGKTNWACKTALEAIRAGWSVYFATLELEPIAIAERMERMEVNREEVVVPIDEWTRGSRLPQWVDAIHEAQDRIANYDGKLIIDQPSVEQRTPTALVQSCKSHGCDFLIVDQLQFVTKPKADSLSESVGLAMQEFKNQLMSPSDNKRLPMLLLHQLNRIGVKTQQSSKHSLGSMADIAHSAWVEQLSDAVWAIGQSKEDANNYVMNIATLKTRSFGPVGWQLFWDMEKSFQIRPVLENGHPKRLEEW